MCIAISCKYEVYSTSIIKNENELCAENPYYTSKVAWQKISNEVNLKLKEGCNIVKFSSEGDFDFNYAIFCNDTSMCGKKSLTANLNWMIFPRRSEMFAIKHELVNKSTIKSSLITHLDYESYSYLYYNRCNN